MYSATTNGIRITVEPVFMDEESEPDQAHYFWAYTIEIENGTPATVQLLARHWSITDSNGQTEEVRGLGVVGEAAPVGLDLASGAGLGSGCGKFHYANKNRFEIYLLGVDFDSHFDVVLIHLLGFLGNGLNGNGKDA